MPDPVLSCSNLIAGYGSRAAVQGISLRLSAGESLLVVGANGAGKSTLLRTLFGLQPLMSGELSVAGLSGAAVRPDALIRHGVRFLGQGERCFPSMSVRRQRSVLSELYGLSAVTATLPTVVELESRAVASLSIGQRRVEAIAMLSRGDPTLMILDEPCAGLDAVSRSTLVQRIGQFAASPERCLVICEHEFSDMLEFVKFALVLRGGIPSYYGSADLLKDAGRRDELFF